MNPVSIDVKDILVSAGLGVYAATTGWAIYVGQEPTTPDTVITVQDLPGDPHDTLNGVKVDDFNLQVRVRANDYEVAYAKIEEAVTALYQIKDLIVGDVRYAIIYRDALPTFLRYDDQNRPIWVCNFAGLRTPS